ncbi:AbrB/MazE/SpoVT family DNA-binding domain-containing protein [Sphingosinicella sp. LHD-64]|uniref:AbrB/MazE/SpoVT family DNA-binding domain-containing protein n=1 Tax=Sphingosinicella sp. LHD-64 TaxID=3072139 RepID=UPI00280E1D6F|nr:AbrB/MazE/SpoVT family DNA-binding domain-containing protein [Sphingosinicella sp. LHD-64]MDQ8756731.1 AbrB/MazE/SpoVT family DNA-binding domain-containing protein [Sphingosinicella sp. LHD-64]
MNAQTKMSAKGQIVIPKELRERLDWATGTELEIEESAGGLILRAARKDRKRLSLEEFRARRPKYEGPPLTLEEIDRRVEQAMAEHFKKEYRIKR